jgi:hypothetical protein
MKRPVLCKGIENPFSILCILSFNRRPLPGRAGHSFVCVWIDASRPLGLGCAPLMAVFMDYISKIAKHVASIPRSGIRDFFDLVVGRDDVISLGVGEPDFVTPWHIREAAIYSLEKGQTTYTANLGLLSLRKSISKYVSGFFEVDYDPAKEILVTVGVSEAIDIALRALLNPGDEVIYHEPCYVSYSPSIVMAHGVAVGGGNDKGRWLFAEARGSRKGDHSEKQGADAEFSNQPNGCRGFV